MFRLTGPRRTGSSLWHVLAIAAGGYLAGAVVVVLLALATGDPGQEVLP